MSGHSMWAIDHDDGSFEQVFASVKPKPIAGKVYAIDRFGDLATEKFDARLGWVNRAQDIRKRSIDAAHDVDHPGKRLVDYAIKQIEARIILGTLATDGLLARESALRGIDVVSLARTVIASSDEGTAELKRVRMNLELEAADAIALKSL